MASYPSAPAARGAKLPCAAVCIKRGCCKCKIATAPLSFLLHARLIIPISIIAAVIDDSGILVRFHCSVFQRITVFHPRHLISVIHSHFND